MTDMKKSIEDVLNGLMSSIEEESRNTENYKNMWNKIKNDTKVSHKEFLREFEFKMSKLASNMIQAWEDKNGVNVSNFQYEMLLALPYISYKLNRTICKEQGLACSVDKEGIILNKVFTDNMLSLIHI